MNVEFVFINYIVTPFIDWQRKKWRIFEVKLQLYSTLSNLLYKTDLKFCEIFTIVQRRKDHFLFVWGLGILSTKSSTIDFLTLRETEESFIICNFCISWRSDYLLYWDARILTSLFLVLKTTNSVYCAPLLLF